MPISGNESLLASQLTSAITAAVEAKYGKPIGNPEYIDALSAGIANALIPFLVSNTEVNPGQTVPGTGLIDSVHGSVTGSTATSTPGTIS
jgi:hypothetical protein